MKKILSVKNVLLVLAFAFLAGLAINATTVKAAPEYDADKDEIVVEESDNKTYFLYLLKTGSSTAVKKTIKSVGQVSSKSALSIVSGLKKKEDKDIFIYYTDAKIEKDGNVTANLKINKTRYKKLVVVPDYFALDTATGCGIASITSVLSADKTKTETIYDKFASSVDHNAVAPDASKWEWSTDNSSWKMAKEFNCGELKSNLDKSIYIRAKGTDETTNERPSKATKIKLAKQPKAKVVKADIKKLTLPLKNGMEYAVSASALDWNIILPYDKTNGGTEKIMATEDYKACDKKKSSSTDVKTYYTSVKVSRISIMDIDGYQDGIYVRTAATMKKPASATTFIEIAEVTASPDIKITVNDVETIADEGAELVTAAALSFTVPTIATDAEDKSGGSKYELAIVNKADLENDKIDWSTVAWKSITSGKKKGIKDGMKTKYCQVNSTSKTEVSIAASDTVVILLRRCGVKPSILASKMTTLAVSVSSGVYTLKVVNYDVEYK